MRCSLGQIENILAGRAQIQHKGDPIIPWVKRTARILMDRMGNEPGAEDRAERAYAALLEDAARQAEAWREEGRDDLIRRLSVLLKSEL